MPKVFDLTGMRFGKLIVVERLQEREDRYIAYRCRCDCGNEIVANSKRLRRGTIRGCADCCPRRSVEERRMVGRRFGKLTVVERNKEAWNGRGAWCCRCDCGSIVDVSGSDLLNGQVTNCKEAEEKHRRGIELTGMKVGWLTVVEKTGKRSSKGSIIWKCECRCGNVCEYSADDLLHGGTISCGCYRRTVLLERMQEGLHWVDGTCVEFLQRKMRCDNTSGYRGIDHLKNGKWRAQITFKGKRYYLGSYEKLEDAVVARQRGERFHKEFLEDYRNGKLDESEMVLTIEKNVFHFVALKVKHTAEEMGKASDPFVQSIDSLLKEAEENPQCDTAALFLQLEYLVIGVDAVYVVYCERITDETDNTDD